MSGDLALIVNGPNDFDLGLEDNDLVTDEGLRTACLLSLFTDCRVERDELPVGEESLRGWWGDLFNEQVGDQLGSRLWLLSREKTEVETLNRAEDYVKECLQWMVDDGVADSLEVTASYDDNKFMVILVLITKPNGAGVFKFQTKWQFEADQET